MPQTGDNRLLPSQREIDTVYHIRLAESVPFVGYATRRDGQVYSSSGMRDHSFQKKEGEEPIPKEDLFKRKIY